MRKTIAEFEDCIKARTQCIWIQTQEEELTIKSLQDIVSLVDPSISIKIWSRTEGLSSLGFNTNIINNEQNIRTDLKDIFKLFQYIRSCMYGGYDDDDEEISPSKNMFILRDFDAFLTPEGIRCIRDLKEYTKKNEAYNLIIIMSQNDDIPSNLSRLFKLINYGLPDKIEIENIITNTVNVIKNKLSKNTNTIIKDKLSKNSQYVFPDTELLNQCIQSCSGLTIKEIKDLVVESFIKFHELNLNYITEKKIQSVKKSGALDYKIPQITLDDIGGNFGIKQWLFETKELFSEDAQKFGLKKPKGYLSVGIPGAGKTCLAEAFAGTMKVPFLSLGMGKIMSRFVGESERKILQAIEVAKASAPCVLLIDEVEKALGGINSSNNSDGGATARVFMEILKFLNDNDSGVYVIMTSNDVSQLPPELTRSGRLDAQWYFGFPEKEERKEIFKIHFSKYNKNIQNDVLQEAVESTYNFTGAEIREVVKNAMIKAFIRSKKDKNDEITLNDIDLAVQEVIPIYKSSKEVIMALQSFCKGRVRNVNERIEIKTLNDNEDSSEAILL